MDAIRDVIYYTESYDVTTIRASTPMFLLARKVKATGVKMVLSGEGSDEVFGGINFFYLFFIFYLLNFFLLYKIKLISIFYSVELHKLKR